MSRHRHAACTQAEPPAGGRSGARNARCSAGFTLIELLVVIAIIAILASVVTLSLFNRPDEARIAATRMQVKILHTAVQVYRTDHGDVPTMEQGLEALVRKPTIAPVPDTYPEDGYLDSREVPDDPWGNEYIYLVPGREGERFEIISYGGDGEPEGTGVNADISDTTL